MGKVLERLDQWRNRKSAGNASEGKGVDIPEYIEWLVWRLVVEKVATLQEVDEYYDLVQVIEAHIVLDIKEEAEAQSVASNG